MTVKNGRRGVICVDAMFTFLTPKFGVKKDFIAHLYAEVVGIECTPQIRKRFEGVLAESRQKHQGVHDDDVRWLRINTEVYRTLVPGLSDEQYAAYATEVHQKILCDMEQYEVTVDSRDALEKMQILREWGHQLVVASNNQTSLSQLLKDMGVKDYFDVVYTSQYLEVRKPSKAFWKIIEAYRGAPVLVMIGNSLDHDAPAAKRNIDTHLIDPQGDLARTLSSGKQRAKRSNLNVLYRRYHKGLQVRRRDDHSYRGGLYLHPNLTEIADYLVNRFDPEAESADGVEAEKQVANG